MTKGGLIDQWCSGCGEQMHEGEPLHKRTAPGHRDYKPPKMWDDGFSPTWANIHGNQPPDNDPEKTAVAALFVAWRRVAADLSPKERLSVLALFLRILCDEGQDWLWPNR